MKIEEAIEILTIMATPSNPELLMNKHLALKLGIAALKRVNEIRNGPFGYTEFLLPGETKE